MRLVQFQSTPPKGTKGLEAIPVLFLFALIQKLNQQSRIIVNI